jgi:hypothetical protein
MVAYIQAAISGGVWRCAILWEVRAEEWYQSTGDLMAELGTDGPGTVIWKPVP